MMPTPFSRRMLLLGTAGSVGIAAFAPARAQGAQAGRFLVTNPTLDALTFLHEEVGEPIEIAPSPWGVTKSAGGLAYVSCAQHLTIVDTDDRTVLEEIPYRTLLEIVGYGEYRSGGMGVAVTPDEATVAVGIHMNGSNGLVELFDVASGTFVATLPVGVRPFDVVASPDSRFFYAIDHDSFTITAIDLESMQTTTIDAAPLGHGQFDKPHYAAVLSDGRLLLPYVGQLLWMLDPVTGTSSSLPMTSNTHQHGIALSDDERFAYVVGTGPAGPASGPPSLTIIDLQSGEERIIELSRPHEQVALTDDGTTAILTGGYTFADGGWNGLSRIDLDSGVVVEEPLPGHPLAIVRLDSMD